MNRPQNQKAFTLVETLVSVAIFLVIMAILGTILSQFLSNTNRMASVMKAYDGVRMFGTQISTEMGSTMVRVNKDRWLNFKVEEDDDRTKIFFTSPDDSLRSVRSLNFISHYVYYWDKEAQAIYRGVYNTSSDPSILSATGADADNKDTAANQKRLTSMTLAYKSGSPYGWTFSGEMKALMDQKVHNAVVQNVFDFKVRCFKKTKREDPEGSPVWDDHTSLPLFVELEIFVADNRSRAALRRELARTGELSEKSRKTLRRFIITVPMTNHGINDNRIH